MKAMKDVENVMVSMIQMIAQSPFASGKPSRCSDEPREMPRGNQGHYTSYYDHGHET